MNDGYVETSYGDRIMCPFCGKHKMNRWQSYHCSGWVCVRCEYVIPDNQTNFDWKTLIGKEILVDMRVKGDTRKNISPSEAIVTTVSDDGHSVKLHIKGNAHASWAAILENGKTESIGFQYEFLVVLP